MQLFWSPIKFCERMASTIFELFLRFPTLLEKVEILYRTLIVPFSISWKK